MPRTEEPTRLDSSGPLGPYGLGRNIDHPGRSETFKPVPCVCFLPDTVCSIGIYTNVYTIVKYSIVGSVASRPRRPKDSVPTCPAITRGDDVTMTFGVERATRQSIHPAAPHEQRPTAARGGLRGGLVTSRCPRIWERSPRTASRGRRACSSYPARPGAACIARVIGGVIQL